MSNGIRVFISPEDRASNVYNSTALWNGHTTNEKEQMGRFSDYLETELVRCGFEVKNAQYGNMYQRVIDSNTWKADLHIAPHTNGFDGIVAGTRVHCYPSEKSREIGRLIQNRIAPLSPGTSDKLVENEKLYELKAPYCPAVLPEFGFHDNAKEAQWIIDNMKTLAVEAAKAICEFFGVEYVDEVENDIIYRIQVGAFKNPEYAKNFLSTVKVDYPDAFLVKEVMKK